MNGWLGISGEMGESVGIVYGIYIYHVYMTYIQHVYTSICILRVYAVYIY